jgi:hypothetical protein
MNSRSINQSFGEAAPGQLRLDIGNRCNTAVWALRRDPTYGLALYPKSKAAMLFSESLWLPAAVTL